MSDKFARNRMNKIFITFLVVTAMVCQNIAWAGEDSSNCIAPSSMFTHFDKYFKTHEINIPSQVKLQIFAKFKNISEKGGDFNLGDIDLAREIKGALEGIEKYVEFDEESIQILSESGNKFFSAGIDFIAEDGKRFSKTVIFYNPERPPYNYLKIESPEGREYARERGFWIMEREGALKDIGPPLDEKVIRSARRKEPGWRKQAKDIGIKQYTHNISAKVFQVNNLPKGLNAWHFREEDRTLVIVTRAPLTPPSPQRGEDVRSTGEGEIIFHEYREDYWIHQKGLSQRDAHILASAEQVIEFAEEGKLTLYHQSQISGMKPVQLREIINEKRDYHNGIVSELGNEKLSRIKEYESLLKRESIVELSKLGGKVQNLRNISHLQFAVPVGVLRNAVDFTLTLKKMEGLRGNTDFELFVYDVEDDLTGDEIIKKLNLNPRKIKIYIIRRSQIPDSGNIGAVREFIHTNYPLGRGGLFMITTGIVPLDNAEAVKDELDGKLRLGQNEQICVLTQAGDDGVISLSRIIMEWLNDLHRDRDQRIRIILPKITTTGEMKKRLEDELANVWDVLKSA